MPRFAISESVHYDKLSWRPYLARGEEGKEDMPATIVQSRNCLVIPTFRARLVWPAVENAHTKDSRPSSTRNPKIMRAVQPLFLCRRIH